MGPPVKIPVSGFVKKEILKNKDFLNPIVDITKLKEMEIDGQRPFLYLSLSDIKIEMTPQGAVSTYTYAVDYDEKAGNGRCSVEDKWIFDPKDGTLLEVTRDLSDKSIIPPNHQPLCDRLKSLRGSLNKDDPLVQQFHKSVNLELPVPSEMTEEESSSPGYAPALTLGSFRPLSPPQSLEEAHLRRLVTLLPTLSASYRKIPEANLMLQLGIGALQKGFLESNPAFEKLHRSSKSSVELKLLSQGLLEMSRGELSSAQSLWTGLRSKNPAARALLRWLEDYTQAKKSLGTLKVIQTAISEELAKDRRALGKEVQDHPEKISGLISHLEIRIIQGKAHSISEAMRQVEATGTEEEKILLARIQSPQFARGVVSDLARGSGLTGDLESQTMMAVAYEKLVPQQSMMSAAGVFRLMGQEGRSSAYAEAGHQGLLALSGQGNFAHELDFTVQRVTDQLTDPIIVASFIAGQSAYQWGQYYALSRWGGFGLRSTLFATGVGVSLEAPTFEFTQRALSQASGRDGAFRDFDKGVLKSWLTFGTFRGMGLGTRYGSEYLQKNQILPLGKWTIPVFTHGSSFGALHGMGELERGLELKPREGSWPARLLLDGAFYLQATAVHPIGETMMGPNISSRIQGLERANSIVSKFSALPRPAKAKVEKISEKGDKGSVTGEIKVPETEEVTRLGDEDLIREPRTVWVRMEAEIGEDGRTVHPEVFFPLPADKNTWWIGRDSKRSRGNLDIPLPGDTREVSRYHARISLDEQGNYILEPTPREESSFGRHSLFIYSQNWGPLKGPLNLQNGSKLRFEGTKIFKFSHPSSETDLKMLNRELAKYSVEIVRVLNTENPTEPVYYRLDPLPPKKGTPPVLAVEYGYGNWEAITQPILLMKGAEVHIGDSRILHFDVPEPPASVARPTRASSPPPPPPSSPPPPPPGLGQRETLRPTGEATRNELQVDDPTIPERRAPTILPPAVEGPRSSAASLPPGPEPILLRAGEWVLGTTQNDLQEPRRANHHVRILHWGEAAAFTHVGIDKKHLGDANKFPYPINEDAYGMGLDFNGRPVFVVGDGMGYYGSGDHASARMVETVLKTVAEGDFTLGEGLLHAHKAIQQDNAARLRSWEQLQVEFPMGGSPPEDAATVGGAIRVDPKGHVEVGLVGDIRLWLLKAQPDGNFEVIEPYFPDYLAGVLRERGNYRTTLQMLSAELDQNPVLSGLGHDEAKMQQAPLRIVTERKAGDINTILNNVLTLPLPGNHEARRAPYQLQKGDHLLLMSDGVAGQFNRDQLGLVLQGKQGILEMLKSISEETARRQGIYLKFAHSLNPGERAQIPDGRYIDRKGSVYATNDPADTEVVAHFSPDNVVALVFGFEPTNSTGPSSKTQTIPDAQEAGSGSKRKRADTTQLNLPIDKAADITGPRPAMPDPLPPPPFYMVKKSVALEPDKTARLYKLFGLDESPPLLEGVRVHRGKDDAISQYRLLTSGGVRYTLLRQFGEKPGQPQEIEGGNHFILGEIGEEVSLRAGDETQTTYHIILDDPQGSAAKLPQLKIFYQGKEETHRFRSTDPKINFGRHYNSTLFSQEKNWISRQHFILTIGQMGHQIGYDLTVQCKYGLSIDGMYYPRGQMVFLQPGRHEIHSITNQTRDEAGQVQTVWDQPITVELPPVEVVFPDWRLAPLQSPPPPPPSPDRASKVPPPSTVPQPQVPGSPLKAPPPKPWWKFWKS